MQPKLSIVMLVYKTAHLLRRSIDAIVSSDGYSPDQVEIIVVSDNSPDDCDAAVAACQRAYRGIRYVRREENGGEAKARNSGLAACTGRYYTSVDADDTVRKNYIREIFAAIDGYDPDMISYGYAVCDENGHCAAEPREQKSRFYDIDHSRDDRRGAFEHFALELRFNCVVRRALIEGQRYNEEFSLGVDTLFNLGSFLMGRRCCSIGKTLHNYYQYDSSITHNFNERRIYDMLCVHNVCREQLAKWRYYDDIGDLLFAYFNRNYFTWIYANVRTYDVNSKTIVLFRDNFRKIALEAYQKHGISYMRFNVCRFALSGPTLARCGILRVCTSIDRTKARLLRKLAGVRFMGSRVA